jgi:2-amino-4-hydroxy-6-hydroxymethyldihydropteridine diphosphokinase
VKRVEALLLLGVNLGDRAATLRRAVAALSRTDGVRVLARSRALETAPVGPSDRPYLNQALRISTTRTPMGLLLEAKILEAAAGRRPGPRWGARPLDIDLIAYGRARVRTAWLAVPHALAARRGFVLAPLMEIAPRWRLAGDRTVASIWAKARFI